MLIQTDCDDDRTFLFYNVIIYHHTFASQVCISLFIYQSLFSFLWTDSNNWLTKQNTGGVHYVIAPQCYFSAVDETNILYNIGIQSCLTQLPC